MKKTKITGVKMLSSGFKSHLQVVSIKAVCKAIFSTVSKHFFRIFYAFVKSSITVSGFINFKDSLKGLMCQVLHMARCTNVLRLKSCPFTPKSCGVHKRHPKNYCE